MSTTLGCKDIGIRKCEFVAKTQFICILCKGHLIKKYLPSSRITNTNIFPCIKNFYFF